MATATSARPNSWTQIPQDGTDAVVRSQMKTYFENFPGDLTGYEMHGRESVVEVRARDGSSGFVLTDDCNLVPNLTDQYVREGLEIVEAVFEDRCGFSWRRKE